MTDRDRDVRERCAEIADADKGTQDCPYARDGFGAPTWNHTEDDLCPACGQTGKDDGSKCLGLAKNRIAKAIRALDLPLTSADSEYRLAVKATTDERREELKRAFVAGCCATLSWCDAGMPQDDLDEAGYDYARKTLATGGSHG